MKKQLLLILMTLLPVVAWADAVEIDGIKYNLISKLLSAEVVGTSISTGNIIIPEMVSYDGISYSVTTICDYCFRDRGRISSITIPKTIQKIGKEAFWNCLNLESVHIFDIDAWCNILFENARSNPMYFANQLYLNGIELNNLIIPTNITSIANYTFFGCGNFTSVSIPNSVTSIGEGAFSECSGLTSVTIPNGVAFIGRSAFTGCI